MTSRAKFFVLLGVLVVMGALSVGTASAHCTWKHPHHCVGDAADGVVDITASVYKEIEDIVVDTVLEAIPGSSCGSGWSAYVVPDSFGVPITGPKANFTPACDAHDLCYDQQLGQGYCDDQFEVDLKLQCDRGFTGIDRYLRVTCYAAAEVYAGAVRNLGGDAYADALTFIMVHYQNKCNVPIYTAIHYKNLDDEWVTDGWWYLEPGESNYVVQTRNTIFYVYAESEAPFDERIYWGGDQYWYVNNSEEPYGFIETRMTLERWGTWTQGFTC